MPAKPSVRRPRHNPRLARSTNALPNDPRPELRVTKKYGNDCSSARPNGEPNRRCLGFRQPARSLVDSFAMRDSMPSSIFHSRAERPVWQCFPRISGQALLVSRSSEQCPQRPAVPSWTKTISVSTDRSDRNSTGRDSSACSPSLAFSHGFSSSRSYESCSLSAIGKSGVTWHHIYRYDRGTGH
jgi:hypothetical protein